MKVGPTYPELFRRSEANPILTPEMWPYPIHTVFNPAAIRLTDGSTLLLCRCEDRRGISHLCAARSADGVSDWTIDPKPTLWPDARHKEEMWGLEDARITYIEEIGAYAVTCTAYGSAGPGVTLMLTKDFVKYQRRGIIMPPNDKDAAIFPRRIGGQFRLIHRPVINEKAHMWISTSPDLQHWGEQHLLLKARRGAWWDAGRIGLSPPPLETKEGWLLLYHGAQRKVNGSVYRLGLALLDLEHPEQCLLRSDAWVMAPEKEYEQVGDVPYVVFPCGWTLQDDGDTLNVYYGAADSVIGLAHAKVSELMAWLKEDGRPPYHEKDDE
jgi:predicted GH43/DUF377 family glycosyl hydrolase